MGLLAALLRIAKPENPASAGFFIEVATSLSKGGDTTRAILPARYPAFLYDGRMILRERVRPMDWLRDLASDDFGKVVVTVVGTLVVTVFGAFLAAAKDIFTDWYRRHGHVRYNVMLLSVALDKLIDDCVAISEDEGTEDQSGECRPSVPSPSLTWPAALDWTMIPHDIMYRCLMLPGTIDTAEEVIDFVVMNIASPPDHEEYFEERQHRYAAIGLAAVHLLNRLRDDFNVQYQDRSYRDPQKGFEQRIKRVEKVRLERQEAAAALAMKCNVNTASKHYRAGVAEAKKLTLKADAQTVW